MVIIFALIIAIIHMNSCIVLVYNDDYIEDNLGKVKMKISYIANSFDDFLLMLLS